MAARPTRGEHHDGRRRAGRRPRAVLPRALALLGGLAAAALAAAPPAPAQSTPFDASTLAGTALSRPTSLQFGPDRRLYVAQQNGIVKAHTVVRETGPDGRGAFRVTGTETITLVTAMANHTDRGAPAPAVRGRHVTGLHVAGTPQAPIVYLVSSDPQVSAGDEGLTLDVDTNSGVLSRLTRGPGGWTKTDLVRGLPRSEEQHSANGLTRRGGTLFIAVGGNTNNGAPSQNFGGVPEYALSAAILSVDLAAVEARAPYDLPTLDDPSRPGVADPGDPFGGNGGLNQAVLVPGGPVQVHASGTRNPYDVVLTQAGRLFTIDNGGNGGWGGVPVGEGTPGCVNREIDRGTTNLDELYDVTAPGTYAGHPNPTRANPGGNLFGGQPAAPGADPVQCDHRVGAAAGALASFRQSTNGLTEYTARRPFGGALAGSLIAADYRGQLWRIGLGGGGATVTSLVEKAGIATLDVTAQGDAPAPFPGTVWFTDVATSRIGVLEPSTRVCDLRVPDGDGDGFANADEEAAGTDPCSSADRPDDVDGDRVSDVTDDDDDGDGLRDATDPFARDAANGLDRPVPFTYDWENEQGAGGSIWNLGFRGLMTNGTEDYLRQFDPAGMTVGGAAGVLTVDEADDGDATGPANTQRNAFQFGIAARPAGGSVTVRTRVVAPFADAPPREGQSFGAYVGTGGQDDYVKLVVGGDGGPSATLVREVGGAVTRTRVPLALPTSASVDLLLTADPRSALVQAAVAAPAGGASTAVGGPVPVPASWFTNPRTGLAVGIVSTSAGPAPPFAASWDEIAVSRGPALAAAPGQAGRPGTAPAAGRADRTRPVLRHVRLSRTRVRTGGPRSRRGTTVRFGLSEAATVQLTVARRTTGRRVRGTCRRTTRATRRARACVRYAAVSGRIARKLRAGRSRTIAFDGRIGGRRLTPGRHRLTLVAVDAAANRSKPVRVVVRVVR